MQIEQWLEDLALGDYAQAFADNDIDLGTLTQLTDADLRELGVSIGHRKRLRAAIAALSDAHAAPPAPASASGPEGQAAAADVQALVLTRFPFPIAYGYRRVLKPESAVNACDCVFYTYTALARSAELCNADADRAT